MSGRKRCFIPFLSKCGCSKQSGANGADSETKRSKSSILDYSHSNLDSVPNEIIANETTLEELYLDYNRLDELPRWLFSCHNLRVLSLNDNRLQTVNTAISNLIYLERLDVSKNCLRSLPGSLEMCRRLNYLELSSNAIVELPFVVLKMVNLRELYLNSAYLDFLPENFGE